MISIVKKKNKLRDDLLSKIEWACSFNSIKLEQIRIYEGCLRIMHIGDVKDVHKYDKIYIVLNGQKLKYFKGRKRYVRKIFKQTSFS